MAEVGWDWNRGTTQGRWGTLSGHGHGQCGRPWGQRPRLNTEWYVHSNSACYVYTTHTFHFPHEGPVGHKNLQEKAENRQSHTYTLCHLSQK
jgi:hypothetical protein